MSSPRILVIGGGVGGSVCALRLRQHGIDVCVAEQATFPRDKVCGCCLGGAGLQTLKNLGLLHAVSKAGVSTCRWRSSLGGSLVDIELPEGIAISRRALDVQLIDAAETAGASVLKSCKASIESADAQQIVATLHREGETRTDSFDSVVLATGLNATSGGAKHLPWEVPPHGPFGVAYSARSDQVDAGIIYMACDSDGYVGLVKLEDGRIDVAAALTAGSNSASSGSPQQRIEAILQRSEFPEFVFHDHSAVLTTPPLRRRRTAGRDRVLAIGDAAGYVEPFTGEGMTWAMQSGIAAADVITSAKDDLSQIGQVWDRKQRSLLRFKKLTCGAVTTALRSPLARRAVGRVLSSFPALATPLIRKLNRI